MRIVMALAVVLVALLPVAPASASQHAANTSVSQSPCGSEGAACAEVCKPDSAPAIEHLQAPVSPPASTEVDARDKILPDPAPFIVSIASLAQAGPPVYLRYHCFLL